MRSRRTLNASGFIGEAAMAMQWTGCYGEACLCLSAAYFRLLPEFRAGTANLPVQSTPMF